MLELCSCTPRTVSEIVIFMTCFPCSSFQNLNSLGFLPSSQELSCLFSALYYTSFVALKVILGDVIWGLNSVAFESQ